MIKKQMEDEINNQERHVTPVETERSRQHTVAARTSAEEITQPRKKIKDGGGPR